jgi:hypothetical protein
LTAGLSLAKVTMANTAYCMNKELKALLPLGTDDL